MNRFCYDKAISRVQTKFELPVTLYFAIETPTDAIVSVDSFGGESIVNILEAPESNLDWISAQVGFNIIKVHKSAK